MMDTATDAPREQELSPMPREEPEITYPQLDQEAQQVQREEPARGEPVAAAEEPKRGPCLARAARWYVAPLAGFGRSLARLAFHVANFAWALVLWYLVAAFLVASVASIVAMCIGLVFLYLTMEMAVGLAWVDLGFVYHVVEEDAERRAAGRPKLAFKRTLPECGDLRNRVKSLVTDAQVYKILFYALFAKPVVSGVTWWVFVACAADGMAMFLWVWWLVDASYLQDYGCVGNLTCEASVCECHGWAMKSAGDVAVVSLLALLLFPLLLRLSNALAKWCLHTAYFFLTKVYAKHTDDTAALLPARPRPDPAAEVAEVADPAAHTTVVTLESATVQ